MLEILIASILSFALGFNVEKIIERKDIITAILLTVATVFTMAMFIYFMPMMHGSIKMLMIALSLGIFVSSLVSYED